MPWSVNENLKIWQREADSPDSFYDIEGGPLEWCVLVYTCVYLCIPYTMYPCIPMYSDASLTLSRFRYALLNTAAELDPPTWFPSPRLCRQFIEVQTKKVQTKEVQTKEMQTNHIQTKTIQTKTIQTNKRASPNEESAKQQIQKGKSQQNRSQKSGRIKKTKR